MEHWNNTTVQKMGRIRMNYKGDKGKKELEEFQKSGQTTAYVK